jgi:hypothetical protein
VADPLIMTAAVIQVRGVPLRENPPGRGCRNMSGLFVHLTPGSHHALPTAILFRVLFMLNLLVMNGLDDQVICAYAFKTCAPNSTE